MTVERKGPVHWVWYCPACDYCASAGSTDPSIDIAQPEFAERYEHPALKALDWKAEVHTKERHA